jgi:hypothetical protein
LPSSRVLLTFQRRPGPGRVEEQSDASVNLPDTSVAGQTEFSPLTSLTFSADVPHQTIHFSHSQRFAHSSRGISTPPSICRQSYGMDPLREDMPLSLSVSSIRNANNCSKLENPNRSLVDGSSREACQSAACGSSAHHRRSMYERLCIGCWFSWVRLGCFFICIQFIKASSGHRRGIVRAPLGYRQELLVAHSCCINYYWRESPLQECMRKA